MDLYLHIGTEKTGTTTIQEFLWLNQEQLLAKGVQYPKLPGPTNQICLTAAALEELHPSVENPLDIHSASDLAAFRRTMSAELSQAFSGSTCKMAVLSNEHCSSRLLQPVEVQTLHDTLRPHFDRIFIVVYLRRQDELLLSTYSTAVKSGTERQLRPPKNAYRRDLRYDYWKLLSRWADVFGREAMICRRFERSTLKNGDVLDDFLQTLGVENDPAFERPPNLNESLDARCLEFMRLMNAHIGSCGPLRNDLSQVLAKIGTGPLLTLPEELLAEFMENLREPNRKVAEEYFGGVREDSDDPLFLPLKFSQPRVLKPELTAADAIWIMARIWAATQGDVEGSTLIAPEQIGVIGEDLQKHKTTSADLIRAHRKKVRQEKRALERASTETPSEPQKLKL